MRWGLVPSWFKEADPSKLQYNTSNCRSDTIMEKRSFKVPLGKGRRCVVLADGFYEWQRGQRTNRTQPYFIYFPQVKTEKYPTCRGKAAAEYLIYHGFCFQSESLAAADGPEDWEKVWDNWRPLTMAGLFDCWEPPEGGDCLYSYTIITVDSCKGLNGIHHRQVSAQEALKLIHPTENITFHRVSSVVNSSRNNTPECLLPLRLLGRKELKASGSSQKMLQWLATKSPKKQDTKTPQKAESDMPQ
ncbi:hypothetical protein E2I00_011810, partial [Balaenoptera physalus]